MNGYAEQIRKTIDHLPCNEIFIASELKKTISSEISDAIFYKTLERMVKQGTLMHLAKGLYYRPHMKNGSAQEIAPDTIVDYYVADGSGIMVGAGLYVEKGISRGQQKRIELISKKLLENKKHIGEIAIQKTNLDLNVETIPVVETLEILQNYKKEQNLDKHRFIAYLHQFVDNYSDDAAEYVLEHRNYKKSTIAFMARILDWYGIAHSLHNYLSPLSNYKIPTIDELRLEIPEDIQIRLKEYAEGIKDIYKEKLDQIILYGSYAKGNYCDDSDIDIMILLNMSEEETVNYRHDASEFTYDFNMDYNLEIMPMVQSNSIFRKWKTVHPFYKNVNTEGIRLYGTA